MNTTRNRRVAVGLALGAALVAGTASAADAAPVRADRPAQHHVDSRNDRPAQRVVAKRTTTSVTRSTSSGTSSSSSASTSSSSSTSSTSTATTATSGSVTYSSTTTLSTAGLSANAVKVLKAINGTYPQITTIGGIRSGADAQDHATGHALDLMLPNYSSASGKALGQQIANFLVAHHSELGVHYVIYNQHIWNVQRASEGWRAMADRGSDTANHMDHVHVSVY